MIRLSEPLVERPFGIGGERLFAGDRGVSAEHNPLQHNGKEDGRGRHSPDPYHFQQPPDK